LIRQISNTNARKHVQNKGFEKSWKLANKSSCLKHKHSI